VLCVSVNASLAKRFNSLGLLCQFSLPRHRELVWLLWFAGRRRLPKHSVEYVLLDHSVRLLVPLPKRRFSSVGDEFFRMTIWWNGSDLAVFMKRPLGIQARPCSGTTAASDMRADRMVVSSTRAIRLDPIVDVGGIAAVALVCCNYAPRVRFRRFPRLTCLERHVATSLGPRGLIIAACPPECERCRPSPPCPSHSEFRRSELATWPRSVGSQNPFQSAASRPVRLFHASAGSSALD
jgi:hypothetical protein